ncbi:MAG: inorganic phosphate transporter, partial [Deltaproteobacteria bacterium]|nr:inorganic phosphate transporter [Deltaproteobacteria bacterium]
VIGIGLLKGGRSIRWKTVIGITSGWITTPIIAALISLISLFFLQNVFQQDTFHQVEYSLDNDSITRIKQAGIATEKLQPLIWQEYPNAVAFKKALKAATQLDKKSLKLVTETAEIDNMEISPAALKKLNTQSMNTVQIKALQELEGRVFTHRWQLDEALAEQSGEFQFRKGDKERNTRLHSLLKKLYNTFRN